MKVAKIVSRSRVGFSLPANMAVSIRLASMAVADSVSTRVP